MILKILKWLLGTLIALLCVLVLFLYLTDRTYLIKAVRIVYLNGYKSAFLEDYKYFDNRKIEKGKPQPWPLSSLYNTIASTAKLDSINEANKTVAYLIIKNDSIWFEKYYNGYNQKSLSNSFSMAKSITAALLGKAIELGYIASEEDKVKKYLPQLQGAYAEELTIRDLVTMRSGMEWEEKYTSPLSITTKAYFYNNLSKAILELPISSKPNQEFKYKSGNTQLLAMVLSTALPMTLSEFLANYFWKPMGAETDALWQYNTEDAVEKAYCCIASNARDFARFGKLYNHLGRWNNQQILDSNYVKKSIIPADDNSPEYGYGWWLGEYNGKRTITMNGHLGQYVITIPDDNLIIVRLGHQNDKKKMSNPEGAFYQYIDQAYAMLGMKN